MSYNWTNVLISLDHSIREALEAINNERLKIALVTDPNRCLIGIVTDGDIRRALLDGFTLEDKVENAYNPKYISAPSNSTRDRLLELMTANDVTTIPLLKNGIVVGLETLSHALERPKLENPIFILAGGFGRRLHPLTDSCPKPMLHIGDRPILETVLQSFIKAGFVNFYFATHFMPEKIEEHFGNGEKWNVNITYIYEESPLGTGGALGLISKTVSELPLIVMNGDLLTKVDFERLLSFHNENDAEATMCVREYDYQIPFGVVNGENGEIIDMVEKPTYQYFVNAGIYVINPEIVKSVQKNQKIDMPSLLEQHISNDKRVLMFPIHEYWLDIGRMDDFHKAQADIHALDLN